MLPAKWASTRHPGHNDHIPGTTNYLRSRTFQTYFAMIIRCYYPSNKDYQNYGARGILVHAGWLQDFQQFLQDVGHRPPGKTLDRIDPNGNYEPGNVRWSDATTQARNKRKKRHDK